MQSLWKTTGIGAVLLMQTVLTTRAWADEPKAPTSAEDLAQIVAEAGKPGAEHAKLAPLAGNWTYTGKFWLDPGKPPIESTGTVERHWLLGKRFLGEKVVGTGFDGKPGFEGLGLLGFDKSQNKYTMTWASNMSTNTCSGSGQADPSGKKFTFHTECYCPVRKKIVQGRDEVRLEGPDKTVIETYQSDDGKETKVMELVAERKK
jgi:hypothetical protein